MTALLDSPVERAGADASQAERPYVLLVDDDPKNLLALEGSLESLDAELHTARSGSEALHWLAKHDAAAILLDVVMPEMDGFETAKLIRMRPRTQYTPILFLTGMARTEQERDLGYQLGALDYLVKPLDPAMVAAKVAVCVQLHRQQEDLRRAANALRASENRFRSMVAAIAQIVWTADAAGQVVEDLPSWREYTGQSEDEIRGRGWLEAIHPDDRDRTYAVWSKAVAERSFCEVEYRLRSKDGQYHEVLGRGAPVFDADGNVREWVGTCADIGARKRAAEAIRRAAVYNRSLFEANPDPLVAIDPDGLITDINAATEAVTGRMRDELIGRDFSEYFTNPDAARQVHQRASRQGTVRDCPLEFRHRDDHVTPVVFNTSVYRDETGKVLGVFAAARDLTQLRQTERALQHKVEELEAIKEDLRHSCDQLNEAQRELEEDRRVYRELFTLAPAGYLVTSPTGTIEKANDGAALLAGVTPQEMVRVPAIRFVAAEDRGKVGGHLLDLREGRLEGLRNAVIGLGSGKASPVPCDLTISANRNAAGAVTNLLWLIVDITERKQAEGQLARERQRFLDLVNQLPVSVCLLRSDCRVIFGNPMFEKMFGKPDGQPCSAFNFGSDAPNPFCQILEVLKTGKPHRWRNVAPDGQTIIDVHDIPFTDADGSPVVLEVNLDITEQEKHRELLEQRVKERTADLEAANQEMEAFAYSVSHDLRAPLRAVDGFSQILLKEYVQELPEKPRHYLQMACDNVRQMGRLIDDILRLSRLGRQSLMVQTLDPVPLVNLCLEDLHAEQEDRRVDIAVGALPPCWADANLLKQVWFNLLSNALKFTREREVACIEVGSEARDGETVYFVKDNGVGFDMQYANKLFGVFQRLHPQEEYEGTGIGLALVQRIVHRHDGRIWAEAKPDQGATFYFTLGRRTSHV